MMKWHKEQTVFKPHKKLIRLWVQRLYGSKRQSLLIQTNVSVKSEHLAILQETLISIMARTRKSNQY